jgi:hypothetical protein
MEEFLAPLFLVIRHSSPQYLGKGGGVKAKVLILLLILIVTISSPLRAVSDDSLYPKPFLNSVFYGTAVGFILGFVLYHGEMATFRITSYGLYGGIILGLYVVHNDNNLNSQPPEPTSQLFENRPQLNFTFHY